MTLNWTDLGRLHAGPPKVLSAESTKNLPNFLVELILLEHGRYHRIAPTIRPSIADVYSVSRCSTTCNLELAKRRLWPQH